jgi:hypothetical protein
LFDRTLTCLRGFAPGNAILVRIGSDKYLLLHSYYEGPSPEMAVVKTYSVPISGFASLDSPGHVFAANPAKEGWQDAQLLDSCREPTRRGRPSGAAPRFVSGRDQPFRLPPGASPLKFSTRTPDIRGHWRCFPRIAPSRLRPTVRSFSFVCPRCGFVGRGNGVRAGWPDSCGESYSWIGFGPIACRRTARARGGITSCRLWCRTG